MAITTVRWSSIGSQEKFRSLAQATYVAPTPSTMGMVLLTPTSIAHSGTSASIGANGQVTFTAVTSLSLNGVFSATYDNYMVAVRTTAGTGLVSLDFRWRAAGTDASGSNYTWQYVDAGGLSVTAGRSTTTGARIAAADAAQRNGFVVNIYGPFLAQPTSARSVTVSAYENAYIADVASTHSLSTSYDGLTLLALTSNITGALQVYGVRS